MNLPINLQPKQHELLELMEHSTASWLGYGGSRGGGKSKAARDIMTARRLSNPGTWGMIFRRVYDDIKRNHIDKYMSEYPQFERFYSRANHEIEFPNKSKIVFGYAETADEVRRKFWGPEYMDIFVDQAEQCTENELQQMKTACRWPSQPDNKCKFVMFFNPGGVGTAFLKRIFFDQSYKEKERREDYAFIQAYGWDNVEWMRETLKADDFNEADFYSWPNETRFEYFIQRSQYGRELNSLPANLRIGHLLGSFERFAGQFFDRFDRDKTVISPVVVEHLVKPWWHHWISLDWGFAHSTAVFWFAKGTVQPEDARKYLGLDLEKAEEVVITYREFVVNNMAEPQLAETICEMTSREEKKQIHRIFLSPDAFAKRGSARTIAQQIGDVLVQGGLPRPVEADNDRVGGWRLAYNLLQSGYDMGRPAETVQ